MVGFPIASHKWLVQHRYSELVMNILSELVCPLSVKVVIQSLGTTIELTFL